MDKILTTFTMVCVASGVGFINGLYTGMPFNGWLLGLAIGMATVVVRYRPEQ